MSPDKGRARTDGAQEGWKRGRDIGDGEGNEAGRADAGGKGISKA